MFDREIGRLSGPTGSRGEDRGRGGALASMAAALRGWSPTAGRPLPIVNFPPTSVVVRAATSGGRKCYRWRTFFFFRINREPWCWRIVIPNGLTINGMLIILVSLDTITQLREQATGSYFVLLDWFFWGWLGFTAPDWLFMGRRPIAGEVLSNGVHNHRYTLYFQTGWQ